MQVSVRMHKVKVGTSYESFYSILLMVVGKRELVVRCWFTLQLRLSVEYLGLVVSRDD